MTADEARRDLVELLGLPYGDEEEFRSYLAARSEADARTAAYVEWATATMREFASTFTARGHVEGWLPEGYQFEVDTGPVTLGPLPQDNHRCRSAQDRPGSPPRRVPAATSDHSPDRHTP